jgi:SAM-dependent methyltransferase
MELKRMIQRGAVHDPNKLEDVLGILACPNCGRSELRFDDGSLACTCGQKYPVRGVVPDFTSEASSVAGFEYQWEKRREGVFESGTLYGKTIDEEEEQFFQFLGIDEQACVGKTVLDAGCGSGRLTFRLGLKGIRVIGIDLTTTVLALQSETARHDINNVTLIRGDLLSIPLKPGSMSYIWSGGVLHHTGDTRRAFAQLVKVLEPGGRIYIWLYSVNQGVFGRIRQILPFAHRFPAPVLLSLCWLLSLPVWTLGRFSGRYHPMSEIRFKLFDHLGPRYRTVHSEVEVAQWFEEEGLKNVEIVVRQNTGGVGVRGIKPA